MNTPELWYIFLGNVVLIWVFLGLATAVMFSRSRLRKKGHDTDTIEFLIRNNRKRCLAIAVVVPLTGLIAATSVSLAVGGISTYDHLIYVFLVAVLFIIPFPILDYIQSRKNHRTLVVEGGKKVAIDMGYRIWHLVFRPGWEAISAALVIAFFVLQGEYFNLAMLHLAILWLLYLAARGSKFLQGPSLSDLYQGSFLFMVLNHLLILFHLIRFVIRCCAETNQSDPIIGIALIGLLSMKLLYYFIQVPQFRRELTKLTRTRLTAS